MKQSHKAFLRNLYVRAFDLLRHERFAHADSASQSYGERRHTLSQPFKPSATLEAKCHNLREAALRINRIVIYPGEVFSFWHIVGNPNNRRRFRAGRSIHAGVATLDVGGGLCQASGIIHHMALLLGLEVMERHNHSVDLYTDETRFAPIGTDATVFFGFKDLRLRNNTDVPFCFELEVCEAELKLHIRSESELPALRELVTETVEGQEGHKDVTISDISGDVICKSHYRPMV